MAVEEYFWFTNPNTREMLQKQDTRNKDKESASYIVNTAPIQTEFKQDKSINADQLRNRSD